MKIADSAQMAEIDRLTQLKYNIPESVLMENAGLKSYLLLKSELGMQGKISFLAGRGNNAGDAFVIARQCYGDGLRDLCLILVSGHPASGSAAQVNLSSCLSLGIKILDWPGEREAVFRELADSDWLIDGLVGTGLKGRLKEPIVSLLDDINKMILPRAKKIALDLPSGLSDQVEDDFPVFKADYTLAMGLPKTCLYKPGNRKFCGTIKIVNVGFPETLLNDPAITTELLDENMRGPNSIARRFPVAATAYKNQRGHLLVLAGAAGTAGAAYLAATSAARSRCGLVSLITDADISGTLAGLCPSVMVQSRSLTDLTSLLTSKKYTAFLAGPGWGCLPDKKAVLKQLLKSRLPGVIDADGLTLLAELIKTGGIQIGKDRVLTPHPLEFSRLTGQSVARILNEPRAAMEDFVARYECTVILKGHVTYVMLADQRCFILDGMNPALATAGTGDVLSGILGGLMAQGLGGEWSAKYGVCLHSYAARHLSSSQGWFIAEDLVKVLSLAVGGQL